MATLLEAWGKDVKIIDGNNVLEKTEELVEEQQPEDRDEFISMLIEHINALYSKMLGQEIGANAPAVQTRSWYNPGHSSVTESA
ncbi:MAG: hypothetical protein H8D23_26570 [Candidatus Brocadiales bacterium]|nr:hypothetical protein [Candidatus Brocadiales bacterium]